MGAKRTSREGLLDDTTAVGFSALLGGVRIKSREPVQGATLRVGIARAGPEGEPARGHHVATAPVGFSALLASTVTM